MWNLIGAKSKKVYFTSSSYSEVFCWLNDKTANKSSSKRRETQPIPEPLRIKKI